MEKKLNKVELEYQRLLGWGDKDREDLKLLLFEAGYDKEEESKELAEVAPITVDDIEVIKKESKNFGMKEGLGSFLWQIDNMTAGFAPGELIIVMGQTNMGKSLVTANLEAQQAMAGHKVVFITLETDAKNLKKRLWQIMGEEQFNWVALQRNFFIQTHSRIPYTSIKYLVKKAKEELGAEIVYIDHLHYFSRDMQDQANGLGMITQEFKIIALENNIPIVLVSHVRKMEDRYARPGTDDARCSSFIAQDADVVLSVWQNPKECNFEHILVGLEKNRNRCIWKNYSYACFQRDGVKILPSDYTVQEDALWNITRRFREKYFNQEDK